MFAYSDPDSNTGYMVPRQMLKDLGRNPDGFFRHTFFTYSHTRDHRGSGGTSRRRGRGRFICVGIPAIGSEPRLTAKTKIIQRSESFGFPPLVYRIGVDQELRARMTDALLTMDKDPEGRGLLAELMLDRFIESRRQPI